MTDIVQFDPAVMASAVREKIRGTIVDLIPKEQWDAMIQQEIDVFLKGTSGDRYGFGKQPPQIRPVVDQVMKEEIARRTRATVAAWAPEEKETILKTITGIVLADGPRLLREFFEGAINTAVKMAFDQIQYNQQNGQR